MRKVVTGVPGKTGLVYTLDRETGEFLWARPTVPQNVIERIDGATGVVVENPEVVFTELEQERLICPSLLGGKDWEAGAYSPLTNTMYYPLRNLCSQMTTRVGRGAMHYALVNETQPAPGKELLGTVYAISAETGETRLAPRAAGGDDVARRDRGWSRVRRRHRRPLLGSGPRRPAKCCGRSTSAPR